MRRLSGGIQDLGKPTIEELMIEWQNPLFTKEEAERYRHEVFTGMDDLE